MKEDFKKWLQQDDLYEYYQNNPEERSEIVREYLHESEAIRIYKDVENWVKWVASNPEKAREQFPIHMHKLEERIRSRPNFDMAIIIQELPLDFHKLKKSIGELEGKTRTKVLKQNIELYSLLLEREYNDEVIEDAINSVKDELIEQREFLLNELNTPKSQKDKSDNLRNILKHYGFFGIPKVVNLSEDAKLKLFELIYESELPYVIAMLDYLDFLPYLVRYHFSSKLELCREMAGWFQKSSRSIKGNINSLMKNSRENKTRYTAHLQKEIVEKDYLRLK